MRGSTDFHERTIPSYLAVLFNGTAAGPRAVFLNLGVISFNSLMETKYLQKLLIERPPPALVIFLRWGQRRQLFRPAPQPWAHHGYRQVQGLIESYHRSFFGLLKPLNAAFYASFTRELLDKVHQVVLPLSAEAPELKEFVNLQNVLTGCTGEVYRRDGVHLNEKGREMVARGMAEVLQGKFPRRLANRFRTR